MLGILKTYDAKTNKLIRVWAKNDCDFDCDLNGIPEHERYSKGFASFGIQDKCNPDDCEKFGITYKMEIYKSCNEEKPMFTVDIDSKGVALTEHHEESNA